MKYPWKITANGRFIDSGTIEAENESEGLNLVILDQVDKGRDPDTCYSFTCGDTVTTSYGDEFERSAGAGHLDDTKLGPSGHTFAPKLSDVGIDPNQESTDECVKEIAEAIAKKVIKDAIGGMAGLGNAAADCGKTFEECRDKFDNAQNFGGIVGSECSHVFNDPGCGYDADRAREFEQLKGNGHVDCEHRDMNTDAIHPITGDVHAQCHDCGYIDPTPARVQRGFRQGGVVQNKVGLKYVEEKQFGAPIQPPEIRRAWINDELIYDAEGDHVPKHLLDDAVDAFIDTAKAGEKVMDLVFPELTPAEKANQDALIEMRERMTRSMGIPTPLQEMPRPTADEVKAAKKATWNFWRK